jgi:hypothetical protein
MKYGDGSEVVIGVFFGTFAGIFIMGQTLCNVNRHHEDLSKAEEICAKFDSTPKYYDVDDELVCENGMEVNYRKFKSSVDTNPENH